MNSLELGVQCPQKPAGWQSIETAPKDGTWVLLYDPAGVEDELAEPTNIVVGRWTRVLRMTENCWCVACLQGGYDNILPKPTHWQPLPPPPGEGDLAQNRLTPRTN